MTCHDLIDVLADYLDQVLPPEVVADLERHLAGCEPCRAYLATYRRTRALGARAVRLEMPDEMKLRLRQFLLERLG
jgi:anti-sigma factor RsiW